MNPKSRLQHREHAAAESRTQQTTGPAGTVATPEELLRLDAAQQRVPPAVGERLQHSVEREGLAPPRPWWQFWKT